MTTADESVTQRPDYKRKRGELRIYLGAAPGVGKTYAMLGEAHRRVERGTDLVAAVVETHGRKRTADLLGGIEVIPPHYIEYRGGSFPELDVEAVMASRAGVVLVEELARLSDPRLELVTLTGADASTDLGYATLYYSALDPAGRPQTEEQAKATSAALHRATPHLRREVGRQVRWRNTPALTFKVDPSIADFITPDVSCPLRP